MDLKCALPKSLLNYGIRKGAGILHYMIAKESVKIEEARKERSSNKHLERIERDPSRFYAWLQPRLQEWFACKNAGLLPKHLPLSLEVSETRTFEKQNDVNAETNDGAWNQQANYPQGHDLTKDIDSGTAVGDMTNIFHLTLIYIGGVQIWSCVLFTLLSMRLPTMSFYTACVLKSCCTYGCSCMQLPNPMLWLLSKNTRVPQKSVNTKNRFPLHLARMMIFELFSTYAIWIWLQPKKVEKAHTFDADEQENFFLITSSIFSAVAVIVLQLQQLQ